MPKYLQYFYIFLITSSLLNNIANAHFNLKNKKTVYTRYDSIITAEKNIFIKQKRFFVIPDRISLKNQNNFLYFKGNLLINNGIKNYCFKEKLLINKIKKKGRTVNIKYRVYERNKNTVQYKVVKNSHLFKKGLSFVSYRIYCDNLMTYLALWEAKIIKGMINSYECSGELRDNKIKMLSLPLFCVSYFSPQVLNIQKKGGSLNIKFINRNILRNVELLTPYHFNVYPDLEHSHSITISDLLERKKWEKEYSFLRIKRINKLNKYFRLGDFLFIYNNYLLNYEIQKNLNKIRPINNKYIDSDYLLTRHFVSGNKIINKLLTFEKFIVREFSSEKESRHVLPWIKTYTKISSNFKSDVILSTNIVNLKDDYIKNMIQLDLFNYINLLFGHILNVNSSTKYEYCNLIKLLFQKNLKRLLNHNQLFQYDNCLKI